MDSKINTTNNNLKTLDKFRFQYLVTLSASLSYFSTGQAGGWNSPSIPKLLSDDSPIPLTNDESSWLIVIAIVGLLVTSYPAGWLMDRFGRKTTLLLGIIPLFIGWILIGLAKSLATLFIGRIFFGFSYGFIFSVLPIYLGEISSDKIRGYITTWLIVMGKGGVLYTFSIGPYVTIPQMAWIGLISPCLFVITFIWMPESPYFLLGKLKVQEARSSLIRLRGHIEVEQELDQMLLSVRRSEENRGTFRELFFNLDNRRGLIIIFGLAAMQYLCGNSAIMDYSQIIFSKIHSELEPKEISIILAGVSLFSALLGNIFVDRIGRKPLLLISVTGTGICTTVVGIYFFLERLEISVNSIGWVPISSLMIFKICHGLGLSIVVFALLGEMFPKNLKAVVTATFTIFAGCTDVLVSKLFQTVSDGWGSDVSFWIFAVLSYLAIPFIWLLIPETKGKSLDMILIELKAKRGKDENDGDDDDNNDNNKK